MHYYIVPGYGGTAASAWYEWVKDFIIRELRQPATIISIPETKTVDSKIWQQRLQEAMVDISPDEAVCLVGHSFGCFHILNYLMTTSQKKVMVLLIGAFDQPLTCYPQLTSVLQTNSLDYHILQANIQSGLVLAARDDPIVPFTDSQTIAEKLRLDFWLKPSGGHFVGRRAPVIAQALKMMTECSKYVG